MKRLIIIAVLTAFPAVASANTPTANMAHTHANAIAENLAAQTAKSSVTAVTDIQAAAEAAAAKAAEEAKAAKEQPLDALVQQAAQPQPLATAEKPAAPADPNSSLWVLLFGAGLVAAGGFAVTKYRDRLTPGIKQKPMEHVHTMRLGTKHHVSIIEVDGRRFMLGLADEAVSLIAELDAPERPTEKTWFNEEEANEEEVAGTNIIDASKYAQWESVLNRARQTTMPTERPMRNRRVADHETDSVMAGLQALRARG